MSEFGTAQALMYSGDAEGGSTDYAYTKVFDLSADPLLVDAGTMLSYWIYPQSLWGSITGLCLVSLPGWDYR